jgi:hypothetical protein
MISALLIVHSLLAVALIGAITHQALSVCWPARQRPGSFFASFRAVPSARYTNAIVVLFALTAIVGSLVYPSYRTSVRIVLESLRLHAANGTFELKEHFVSVGLGLLPAYWYIWRQPPAEHVRTRAIVTAILAFVVWWAFLVGHVLNNIRGFGS